MAAGSFNHMPRYLKEIDRAQRAALLLAANRAAVQARGDTGGYNIGTITATARAGPAKRDRRGRLICEIVMRDYRGIFFELGTRKRRRRKLKQPRRSHDQNRGVRAIRMLSKATREQAKTLEGELRLKMP